MTYVFVFSLKDLLPVLILTIFTYGSFQHLSPYSCSTFYSYGWRGGRGREDKEEEEDADPPLNSNNPTLKGGESSLLRAIPTPERCCMLCCVDVVCCVALMLR